MEKNPHRNDREPSADAFDSLPDEMVVRVLSFVSVDSLLDCRLVCGKWRALIDSLAIQEKAARENETANNGRGFYSFSQIDSNTVRKLDLPWYVFYTVCKYDPFNRNLVKNNCGQDKFDHWNIIEGGRSSHHVWIVEEPPYGTAALPENPDFGGFNCCFVSTFRECSKLQNVTFKAHGITDAVMRSLQPEIVVSEWYSGRFDCGCKYVFQATVRGDDGEVLQQYNYTDVLPQWEADHWTKISHTFKNLGNAASLTIFHLGVDTQFWKGHYGTKIAGSVVKVLLPVVLKSSQYSVCSNN